MSNALELFFEDIKNTKILDSEGEIELSKIIQECRCDNNDRCVICRQAIDTFVICNLPLVVKMSKIYRGQDFALQDLIGTGIYGLFIAAGKFDHSKNVRFASYAAYWIRDEILKALRTCSGVPKLPLYPAAKLRKISKIIAELVRSGQEVTIDVIAKKANFSEKSVQELQPLLNNQLVSIDDFTLVSELPLPDIKYEEIERIDLVQKELKKVLTADQLYIVRHTVVDGLLGGRKLSLKSLAARQDMSIEKVKQIRDKAFEILRSSNLLKLLYKEL